MMQMLPCCYKFQKKFLKFSHYKGATYQQNWQTPKKKHGHRPCFHALPKTNKMPWRTNIFKNGNHLQRNLPKSCCHCLALWQWTSWVYWVHYAWCIVPPVIQWMLWATQQPRKISDNILADASAQCRRELLICNKAAKQLYDIYKWVIQSLHSQFQEVINEDYLAELDDPNISLIKVHPSINHFKNDREKLKSLQHPHGPYQTDGSLHKKAGTLSSICGRCWQSHHHDRHGANGGDACSGHGSNAGCNCKWKHIPQPGQSWNC